jgi:SAM-dependent methyltransferase
MIDETLLPEDEMLFDGTGTREDFINQGPGFLWNALVPRARLEPHHRVLDIGSGNGKHARVLTDFLTTGSYAGFDIVPEGVRWCQQAYSKFGRFEFKLADVYSDWYNKNSTVKPNEYVFPYEDSEFDVAYAASLFTHLEPDATDNYIRQAFRVLKPGGRLLMTCFLITQSNRGIHAEAVQGTEFSQASERHWLLDHSSPSRGVAFEESMLRGMLNSSGFKISEITFGTWSNGIDTIGAFQDCIVAVKPRI